MEAARKNTLRKIMQHAATFRRAGVDKGTALRFAWSFFKADKFAPIGEAWRITFAKESGEITERVGLEIRGGRGGAVLFTSSTDGFAIRSFRPERLLSVEPLPLSEAERDYFQAKAEAAELMAAAA